ncbi:hypothetical protein [Gulosibacter massiliensis]|uniref:hypothetical protein n=1 Tax=Gulosibacter massiliensis TaxID=2479839 RepID=UPI000F643B07|nr:hypothetical protein [Gulosibacter massiliensis]
MLWLDDIEIGFERPSAGGLIVEGGGGLDGWYDLPGVKTKLSGREGADGAHAVQGRDLVYSARTVTASIAYIGDTRDFAVRQVYTRINALNRRIVSVRVRDVDDTFVTGYVETSFGPKWQTSGIFDITVTAADPVRYAWDEQTAILTASARVGALDYVIEYPIDYGDDVSSASPSGSVSNTGNVATGPVITVEGSYPRGFTLLGAGGRAIIYPQPVFLGTPVVIDCVRRVAICNGVNVSRNLTRREWFTLPPRSSTTVTLVAGEDVAAGTAWATLSARSAWI